MGWFTIGKKCKYVKMVNLKITFIRAPFMKNIKLGFFNENFL